MTLNITLFAQANHIPVVRFHKGDRKIDVMGRYLTAQAATGRSGVVAIGVAQEYQNVFAATQRDRSSGVPWFSFSKADRRVSCFYFYLWDVDFGPSFIKICAYFPYPIKVWLNGHEWAKRQATKTGIGWTALSNGFATCTDPAGLQQICDRLGPETIQGFFDRWMGLLPLPLTEHDQVEATGGSCRCARSRSPGPSSSTRHGEPGRSLRHWWPTTWTSGAPTASS